MIEYFSYGLLSGCVYGFCFDRWRKASVIVFMLLVTFSVIGMSIVGIDEIAKESSFVLFNFIVQLFGFLIGVKCGELYSEDLR